MIDTDQLWDDPEEPEEKVCRVHACDESAEDGCEYCKAHEDRLKLIKECAVKRWE